MVDASKCKIKNRHIFYFSNSGVSRLSVKDFVVKESNKKYRKSLSLLETEKMVKAPKNLKEKNLHLTSKLTSVT
jgi:hypothetical protein